MITANEIRRRFLDFYAANGHTIVHSSSLVPKDDPSLLFTNAGMVQFKKIFLGQEKREYSRATTSQKCLRVGGKHNDLENVGRTARHHTFFEMLGNFSFGDYFKEDAIKFAWNFITEDLKLPKDRLYVTVFRDDDEAENLWLQCTDIPKERIYRLGEKDNFWSMGDTGPCGPCSEIHIDQGEHMSCGPNCGIGTCDCDRFLEIWNLVFMQYDQAADGTRTPLPRPSIDTGMGLERITAVCQGVNSNFDSDIFQSIIQHTCGLAGVSYHDNDDTDTALRVIADHSRSIAFMITDGILPSNEGRGYVLRRLIRRAYRFGRFIGFNEPFLYKSALNVVDIMGNDYPELRENSDFMARVVREEEDRFNRTLDKGLAMLEDELASLAAEGKTEVAGDVAFRLYDTFGFPIDIINDIAEKRGFGVDEAGFNAHMKEQKTRAKAAWKGSGDKDIASRFQPLLEEGMRTEFIGYEHLCGEGRIVALMDSDALATDSLSAGAKGYLVTNRTPFYGASGGQEGDLGTIISPSGKIKVTDTVHPAPQLVVHHIEVTEGDVLLDQEVQLCVQEDERTASARNHTCTHLLHAALRNVLGDHVKQAGSLVGPDRLRFDFTHIAAMTADEIAAVERQVNRAIMANIPLNTALMSYNDAVAQGAMALFGEKYTSEVRVVSIGSESVELCGGTHLAATGQAGIFLIASESGVAAGVRRIEAVTGWNAFSIVAEQRLEQAKISAALKARPGEIVTKIEALQKDNRTLRKDMERAAAQATSGQGRNLMDEAADINGVTVLAVKVDVPSIKALRDLMDDVRTKMPSGIACLAAAEGEKVQILVAVSKDLLDKYKAPQLIKEIAAEVGGSGGGRPDMAQAGGTNPAGIDAALAKLKALI